MIWPRARRITQVNDSREAARLIQLTDAAGPALLRTCRYANRDQAAPGRRLSPICLDRRADPAIVLGLQLAKAPGVRNAGGRITSVVIVDIAYLAAPRGRQLRTEAAEARRARLLCHASAQPAGQPD